MNKKILIPFIILTSFFFISNVKAASSSYNIKQSEFEKIFYDKNNLTDSEKEKLNHAYQYFNVDFENDYYIAFLYTSGNKKSVIIYKWNKSSTYIKPLSLGISLINNTYDRFLLYLNTNEENSYKEKYYHLYDDSIGNGTGCFHSKGLNLRGVDISKTFQILETNSSILFTDTAYNDSIYKPYKYLNINNEDDDLCLKTFSNGNIIFNENGINIQPPKPEISLLRSENEVLANEILSTTIYIKFSIFDTSKYTYYWKSKLETEWNEITDDLYNGIDGTDEFDYTSTFNDTVYFKVVRNSDNEVVSALTHTFANISEKMPYVTFTTDVPNYCNVNGVTACKGVRAHIINYDPLRHNAYYSLDDETFEPFYPNIEDDYEVYQVFTHNTNWHLKFEDKVSKKKVLFSFNVNGVSSEYDTSTPNVKFEDKLRKVKDTNGNFSHYVMDVNAFIYAFNTDNYNYYYSTDSGQNFQELRDYSVYATDIVKVPFIFKDDARLIIRVTDKNGNLVNDFPYQVEFTKKVEETDKQDNFLTKIFNSAKQKFPIFDQMYNLYKTYLGMEFKDEKPPIPKVNLSFLGINQEYEVIDYTFYDKYRETAFNFVKLGLAIYTMLKLYKIVKSYFGGGK